MKTCIAALLLTLFASTTAHAGGLELTGTSAPKPACDNACLRAKYDAHRRAEAARQARVAAERARQMEELRRIQTRQPSRSSSSCRGCAVAK